MKRSDGFLRTASAPLLAAIVLASASWMTAGTAGRESLDSGELNQSRGRNPLSVLGQASCDGFQGLFACTFPNNTCATCSQQTFTSTIGGITQSGYESDPILKASCGTLWTGTCSATYVCTPVRSVGVCALPSKVYAQ